MSDVNKSDVGFLQVGCRMSDFNKSDVGFFTSRMSDVGIKQVGCRIFKVGCRMAPISVRTMLYIAGILPLVL